MNHSDLMRDLIAQAKAKHGEIQPTGGKKSFEECFTTHNDKLIFWFNDKDNSTCMITAQIDPEAN